MDELATTLGERVALLEAAMLGSPDKIVIEPRHFFAFGLYGREVILPAGATAIGYRHKQEHLCVISQGRVLITSDDGVTEISAPHTMVVPAGRKNCVHAVEETVWTTVHATEIRDIAELEALLVEGGEALSLSEGDTN